MKQTQLEILASGGRRTTDHKPQDKTNPCLKWSAQLRELARNISDTLPAMIE